jgi:hypothetical protein
VQLSYDIDFLQKFFGGKCTFFFVTTQAQGRRASKKLASSPNFPTFAARKKNVDASPNVATHALYTLPRYALPCGSGGSSAARFRAACARQHRP